MFPSMPISAMGTCRSSGAGEHPALQSIDIPSLRDWLCVVKKILLARAACRHSLGQQLSESPHNPRKKALCNAF